ncbi:hypothetical protein ACP275_14G071100 [Erythranthe tilingii]
MNAAAASEAHNGAYESDSESNSDDSSEYYQPISTADGEDEEETNASDQDPNLNFHRLPNGWVENGLSSLDLTNEEEEDEEEATESESAIERAFREDERRRSAPLTEENAVRVMDAMRRISFGGGGGGGAAAAPDWAGQVSDDQWIDRLMRLRRPSSSAATDP